MSGKQLGENLAVALDTLRSHKVRSVLTVLGIVIGVTSVISVAAIIEGLNKYISDKVEQFGSRTYFLSRIPLGPRMGAMPEHIRLRRYLTAEDADYIRRTCRLIEAVTPFTTRGFMFGQSNDIRYGSEKVERFILRGAEPEYATAIPLFAVAQGRFISSFDEQHARHVVVLGHAVAQSLFPSVDPIGKEVRMNGKLYEVIGVFEHDPGLFGGMGVDQFAIVPFSNFHKMYPESKELILAFTIARDAPIDDAIAEVTDAMRKKRRDQPGKPASFEVTSPDFLSNLWGQLTGALVILTTIISSVGLLVGGIGVMNIMLISVTERTSEIGIRKAIGARKADIRVQFLLEAIFLTCTGGAIGMLIGAVIAFAVRTALPSVPAQLSALWIAIGSAVSISVGLFFGFYPANRAANLDPIVALRYE